MWSFLMTQSSCSLVVLVAVLMKLVCAGVPEHMSQALPNSNGLLYNPFWAHREHHGAIMFGGCWAWRA